jgi:molecular chaperone HscA
MTVCVYDLGGGTFDVTILRIHEGLFDVLSTHGDTHLGGDDFDNAIVSHWLTQLGLSNQRIAEDKLLGQELRLKAETAKRTLTEADSYAGELVLEGARHALALDVNTFRELAQPLLKRTLDACAQALADAELTRSDIQEVVLVGGSTRMPVVKDALAAFFGKAPKDHLNPDEVVALGAAVQADILSGNRKDLLLLDVTPLSLGIETAGGLMDVLLPRNSKVPNRVSRRYSTGVDGQVNLRIAVYQGEREKVEHNRKLAEFELKGIPAMPAGLPLVEVAFLLDADGILKVQAQEKRSGVQQEIVVKPSYGLTDAQVEQMLLDSLKHAETDVAERMVLELREAGRQLVYTARRFTERHANLLNETEIADTLTHVRQLEDILENAGKEALQERIDALEAFTKPFAERVMNEAVKAALVGKGL